MKVSRFDIVKALYLNDPLLYQIFGIIAKRQQRDKDVSYKMLKNSFSRVLGHLDIVKRKQDAASRIDIIWEKLFELALFTVTKQHRKPVQILKEYISQKRNTDTLTAKQLALLMNVFRFIGRAYETTKLAETRWATDQTHFYILATSLIDEARENPRLDPVIFNKVIKIDGVIEGLIPASDEAVKKAKEYAELSTRQTTDVRKRQDREKLFREILTLL